MLDDIYITFCDLDRQVDSPSQKKSSDAPAMRWLLLLLLLLLLLFHLLINTTQIIKT